MRYFSFTRWLTVKEGFASLSNYEEWLNIISEKSKEEAKKQTYFIMRNMNIGKSTYKPNGIRGNYASSSYNN
ncbi:hypothetical protein B0P06_004288 [Clostridium saccharoperbutylacetonicum]|uniref:Uncharacterized protein n=1 Tax=Clostridium saccharoperbutylacetonicum N1-4(HMT) TaxID=931276 RepID=M1LW51_9CLOT|nr:hypothetical protein [Clostridium saccharoperbutylacetonicum]AGF57415.1 hypothetical protein Cspa_c36550 [Clostridium saccharoperbutylacetonicum N1-4(HMT)]NRT61821.1 hypothetical protein [Clostridium saccharoperbutylacetonicum]NSB25147.1 hypothetical protein [Clostridium saccharoperbutylacetonicum]NSB44517.1 hypothetical protein [Clostridium saccharoperbutylacetonicum]